ncbi:MAG TPA: MoaD/ThiS family protein [Acidimicrobiales bacterium]|nr:MoaD/ThiS family protein [Acidimicrobiales bacterium]
MREGAARGTVVRVRLPAQLQQLAHCHAEVPVTVHGPVTQAGVLAALESALPVLRNTVRDSSTGRRRPFIRFYVGEEDLSNEAPASLLPAAVLEGREPFVVVGAMAGG